MGGGPYVRCAFNNGILIASHGSKCPSRLLQCPSVEERGVRVTTAKKGDSFSLRSEVAVVAISGRERSFLFGWRCCPSITTFSTFVVLDFAGAIS